MAPKKLWVKVQVQNEGIPPQHRRLRKIRPGRHYFTEEPEEVVVTPQVQRWLNSGALVAVDPPPADAIFAAENVNPDEE